MKKVTFALFFCLGLLTSAYSQTKQESIRELFQLMRQDSAVLKSFDSLAPMFIHKRNQPMDAEAKAKSQETINMLRQMTKMIIDMVTEDKVKLYDKNYSKEEINKLIEFYKSPVGQKYVNTTPGITNEIMTKVLKEYLPEMQKKANSNEE